MATPESNALLGMQLMGAPFAQLNAQNDARTNLLLKLALVQREEQLKRDLLAEQDQRAFKLAEMQAGREDKRNQATLDWHRLQTEGADRRASAADTARGNLEDKKASARSKADLLNEFDRDYPKYVDAMEAAKRPVLKREDFPETRAGLGQMQAETSSAHRAYAENLLKQAAKNGAQGITRLQSALTTADKEIAALEKPTEADEKIARARALAAVRSEVTTDKDRAYEKVTASQKDKGFAALAKGNRDLAQEHLGPLAIQSYDANYELALEGLPNQKARLAAVAQAKRNRTALQGFHEKTFAAFTGASGTNPFISEELEKLTPIETMQLEGTRGAPKSDEDKVRARMPARVGVGTAAGSLGDTETPNMVAQPGIIGRGLGALMDVTPGARTLQRTLGSAAGAIRAPSTLSDVGGGLTALQRWFSPDTGATDTTEEVVTPTQIDVASVLQERPGGPWSEAEMRAIRAFNATQSQGPNLLQRIFPGAR